jgi:hypothetical protein
MDAATRSFFQGIIRIGRTNISQPEHSNQDHPNRQAEVLEDFNPILIFF